MLNVHRQRIPLGVCVVLVLGAALAHCGSSARAGFTSASSGGPGGGSGSSSGSGAGGSSGTGSGGLIGGNSGGGAGPLTGDGGDGQCHGLGCDIHACNGKTTSISGKVFDPAGKNPLYDVAVFVPNAPPDPFPSGAACYSCGDLYSGSPVASALTDATGSFHIAHAPDGANIPLVVQIGKWRKQYVLPSVTMCEDNPQPDGSLKLPRNGADGDIPNIAISTGGYDTLECLLKRIGLDDAEYTPGAGGAGHIHIFAGTGSGVPNTSPAGPASYQALWDTKDDLMKYDVLILSCEGAETGNMNQQALFDYAAAGGRVFASHWHYAWFNTGPFGSANLATWLPGTQDIGDVNATIVTTLASGQPFPKGQAMQQWLATVGALGVNGAPANELPIHQARHNADVAASNTPSQPWILGDSSASPPGVTEYFSFDTPLGTPPDQQCGRVVFSDLHVGAAADDYPKGAAIVPGGCASADLSPQEKALEFMLFDLSSCFTPITLPPQPPPATAQ